MSDLLSPWVIYFCREWFAFAVSDLLLPWQLLATVWKERLRRGADGAVAKSVTSLDGIHWTEFGRRHFREGPWERAEKRLWVQAKLGFDGSCLFSARRLPTCTQTTQMLCLKIPWLTHCRILVVVARPPVRLGRRGWGSQQWRWISSFKWCKINGGYNCCYTHLS